MSTGPQHTPELGEDRDQVGDMAQGQRAHDQVHRVLGQRERFEPALSQVQPRQLRCGDSEHLGAGVHADDVMSRLGEVRGVPTGTAGGVQRIGRRESVDEFVDERFFELDHRVRAVIVRGPIAVDAISADIAGNGIDARGRRKRRIGEQRTDFSDPSLDERLVAR
jgi:hypothetical protein